MALVQKNRNPAGNYANNMKKNKEFSKTASLFENIADYMKKTFFCQAKSLVCEIVKK